MYNHLASTDVFVCFQADREMYFKVEVDANIQLPDNMIESDQMYSLENAIYKSLQDMNDFNKKNDSYTE